MDGFRPFILRQVTLHPRWDWLVAPEASLSFLTCPARASLLMTSSRYKRPERVGLHNWKEVLQTLGERRGNPGWSSVFVPSMVRRGAELGITNMSFDGDVGNSTDSHRLLHWAGLQGWEKQEALANELALSQFTRDECMGDHAVLKACAAEAGLGPVAAGRNPLSNRGSAREHWWGAPTSAVLSGRQPATFCFC